MVNEVILSLFNQVYDWDYGEDRSYIFSSNWTPTWKALLTEQACLIEALPYVFVSVLMHYVCAHECMHVWLSGTKSRSKVQKIFVL